MTLYLVSVDYDKEKKSICSKLYDDINNKFITHYDNSYKPYCLSDSKEHFEKMNIISDEKVKKIDVLNDSVVELYKVFFNNPEDMMATKEYAEVLMENNMDNPFWENKIKIEMSYIYDLQLEIGMPYKIENGKLVRDNNIQKEIYINKLLDIFEDKDITRELIRLFEYDNPTFKRAAIDIEVKNKFKKMPMATIANYPVVCICIYTYEGKRICLLLLQPDKKLEKYPDVDELHVFTNESDMLLKAFEILTQYPMILTFNGDEFDFLYLKNRAHRLRIPTYKIPFYYKSKKSFKNKKSPIFINNSMHIDLYKFLSITAIKNYAFQGRYKNVTLDEVSRALLNKRKFNQEHQVIGEMNYFDLINYCMQDTILTYELTTFDDNLIMHLIVLISRFSRIPIEECSRRAVGRWIGSFLFSIHRKLDYLIPRTEDILKIKGMPSSKSKVKGKQYEGAVVVKPKASIIFNAEGYDFGSLYPSVKKNYNIGYGTINCKHKECFDNKFAGLPHHICKKNRALESTFIGALKDLRLKYYKKQAKNKELTQTQRNIYKAIEQVIKVIVNGDYGVSASDSFAFFCPVASEEIAGIARHVTMETIKHAKEMEIEVHYGDSVSKNTPMIIRRNGKLLTLNIEDVKNGDETLTEKGWTRIINVIKKMSKKHHYMVETYDGCVECTEDHSLINKDFKEVKPTSVSKGSILGKIDYDIKSNTKMDIDEAWLLGFFTADGSAGIYKRKNNTNIYSIYLDNYELDNLVRAKNILKNMNIESSIDSYDSNIQKSGKQLYRLNVKNPSKYIKYFLQCYDVNHDKKVPDVVLNADVESKEAFIEGFICGDGTQCKDGYEKFVKNPLIMFGLHMLYKQIGKKTRYGLYIGQRKSKLYLREVKVVENINDVKIKDDNTIRRIIPLGEKYEEVYDLETENHHFSAGGILLHNTDSLFITKANPEKIKELQKWTISNFGINLELDKQFKFMGFSTRKKNYFGVKPNGEIDIKGLTGKKKHTPQFFKNYYQRILDEIKKINTEDDITVAKKAITEIVKEGHDKLKKREWDNLSDLAFHITSSKMPNEYKKSTPQHVKAIKQLIDAGYDYEVGTEIDIIKTKKNKNKESVMPLELAKPNDVDISVYIQQFESTVSQIIDIFELEWDSILGTTKIYDYF